MGMLQTVLSCEDSIAAVCLPFDFESEASR